MTRTHKATDRDRSGSTGGNTAITAADHLPRYFGKAGFADVNPSSTKKQGGGKGNWGQTGSSELEDEHFNLSKPRRRTNSFSAAAGHSALRTKFEAADPEEAIEYEEALHGPTPDDLAELEKSPTSSTMASVDEQAEWLGMTATDPTAAPVSGNQEAHQQHVQPQEEVQQQ